MTTPNGALVSPRALPSVRIVRGQVLASARLRAKHAGVVGLPVAPDPEGEGVTPGPGTAEAGVRYGIDLAEYASRLHFKGDAGAYLSLDLPQLHCEAGQETLPWTGLAQRLVLIGVGQGQAADFRLAGAGLAAQAKFGPVLTPMAAEDPALTEALVEGFVLGGYKAAKPGKQAEPDQEGAIGKVEAQLVLLGSFSQSAVDKALIGASATMLARDLTNWQASQKTPASFAKVATNLGATAGFEVETKNPKQLADQGFGAILAVGGGAASHQGPEPTKEMLLARQTGQVIDAAFADRSPRLVVASHHGQTDGRAFHLVLVGKGITFDSGGLSIKPVKVMQPMATDCAGAAAALAAVWAAAQLDLPIHLTAILALAENGFGAGSYRPGDTIKVHGGLEVEVVDTDAEGRLVLADALDYAQQLAPDALVDVATLTGAARQALGGQTAALFATNQLLADAIMAAGQASGEAFWQLPLVQDYASSLESKIADTVHLPTKSPGGGAITAALFLRQFVGQAPWAHLDLSPARAAKSGPLSPVGGTGFGTRTLIGLAEDLAANGLGATN